MFGIEKHYCNVSVMCNILMCSNLHCIIGSNVTETNCGTQALIVAANDGVCFNPDHMQHFSLHFRPQLRSGFDQWFVLQAATFITSFRCLDIIKTNNQAGRKETQGDDYKINFQLVMIYFQSEQFVTLKICLLQCVIVTHPVSVTAITWYEKWWHPVTFWQFTDNKQSARNNNHRNGFGRGRPRPLTALQWQIFWMKNCVLRIPVKYVCCHKKFTKNFSIFYCSSRHRCSEECFKWEPIFASYFQGLQLSARLFEGRGESDSWIVQTQCGYVVTRIRTFLVTDVPKVTVISDPIKHGIEQAWGIIKIK